MFLFMALFITTQKGYLGQVSYLYWYLVSTFRTGLGIQWNHVCIPMLIHVCLLKCIAAYEKAFIFFL